MNRTSSVRDLTMRVGSTPVPADNRLLFVACSHKGMRAGSQMRGRVPWRCAACVQKAKPTPEATGAGFFHHEEGAK